MDTSTPFAPVTAVPTADRAPVPPARDGGRRGNRPAPERSHEFSHLSLDDLRAYRRTLTSEEDQVSYWRRIIQARLDVLRAGTLGSSDGQHLRPVLTDHRVESSRTALVSVLPADDIPPLPNLAELWERRVSEDDEQGQRDLDHDLARAERQLSEYRAALHRRIADATGELIARYREHPELCLTALPLRRERRVVSA
jgi:anti-sigma-K factor RsiG